jgi:hypothetical protein
MGLIGAINFYLASSLSIAEGAFLLNWLIELNNFIAYIFQ